MNDRMIHDPLKLRPLKGADFALRSVGLGLVVIAAIAWGVLYARVHHDAAFRLEFLSYLIAAIAFSSGSIGIGLACLGRHIHDPIMTSQLWRPYSDQDTEYLFYEDPSELRRTRAQVRDRLKESA